ncbi:MAG: hypothetical protein ACXW32_01245 [Limisphaerales bacterium]
MKNPQSGEPAAGGVQLLEGPVSDLGAVVSAMVTTSILSDAERGGRVKIFGCACSSCGAVIPETELRRVSEERARLETGNGATVWERCANCEGTEFQFRIQPDSARHWIRVKERLAQTAPDVHEVQIVKEEPRQKIPRARWMMIGSAVLVAIVMFFVVRYWIWGSPIPLVHKPQKYEFNVTLPPPEEAADPEIFKAGTREKE